MDTPIEISNNGTTVTLSVVVTHADASQTNYSVGPRANVRIKLVAGDSVSITQV